MTKKSSPSDVSVPDWVGDCTSTYLDDSINYVSEPERHIAFLSGMIQFQKEELDRLRLQKAKDTEEKIELLAEIKHLRGSQKTPSLATGLKANDLRGEVNLPAIWKSSGTRIALSSTPRMIDALNNKPLISGIVTWKIHVHKEDGMRLGLISAFDSISFDKELGISNSTWGYGGWGDAWHGGKRVGGQFSKYYSGSVIKFVLDLSAKGTLDVSVNGLPFIRVFSNMKSSTKGSGFLPAAYLYGNSNIEFLGFEHHDAN